MEGPSDDENYEPTPKKIKREWVKSYSNKAMEMMKKMGYENDKGLGKTNQGRLEPIIAVQQDGRRGFGLKLESIQKSTGEWDPSCEELDAPETVLWLTNRDAIASAYTFEQLNSYIVEGPRKDTLDEETKFCDSEILHHILQAKSAFDDLNESEKRRARSRCNPYETIRGCIFQNRAAVKMANMDAMCDYLFTNPKDQQGNDLVPHNDLLYFADVCAGPGGFSEYVLFRKSWQAKGFGFTLRGANDFKTEKFFAASPETFDPFYGTNDDGDIFNQDNQDSLNEYIRKHTPEGVHLVMADGGFSVEGQRNIQEILSKQLYLCQFVTALKILRTKGIFVCKLFDIFTPFSVGLVYLMYKCFQHVAIIKPNSSRPANSERYIVCKYKHEDNLVVIQYMDYINNKLNMAQSTRSNLDVLEIYDFQEIWADENFKQYIIESNNAIGSKQVIGLRKIAAFAHNLELKETRQAEMRQKCLEAWKLPDKLRQAPEVKTTERLLEELLKDWAEDLSWLNVSGTEMTNTAGLSAHIFNVNDWYFVPVGRGERAICTLFLCKARGNLLRYADNKKWELVEPLFDVQPHSMFLGEIVYESSGEGRQQTRVPALHIIDAMCLGGIDVRRLPFRERVQICGKYAKSLNKPYKKDNPSGAVRCKKVYNLSEMNSFFNEMRSYVLKDNSQRLGYALEGGKFFVPGGILMFCELTCNFMSACSRSSGLLYYFDHKNNVSFYKDKLSEKALFGSFRNCYCRRLFWKWTSIMQVKPDETEENPKILYRSDFVKFINKWKQN